MLAAGLHLELFSGRDAWARARPRGVLERRRETRKWTPALTPKLIVCVRCFYLLSAMLRRTSSIVHCRRSGSSLSKALVPSEVRRPRGVVDDLRRCGPFPLISTSRALDLRRRRVAGPRIRTLRGGVPSCGRPRPRPSESLSTIEAQVGACQFLPQSNAGVVGRPGTNFEPRQRPPRPSSSRVSAWRERGSRSVCVPDAGKPLGLEPAIDKSSLLATFQLLATL